MLGESTGVRTPTSWLAERHFGLGPWEDVNTYMHIVNRVTILNSEERLQKKSVVYSSHGNRTGQLDFCNWLVADGSTKTNNYFKLYSHNFAAVE